MALREIKRDAIPLVVNARLADRRDDQQYRRALLRIIERAIEEPGSTIAADLRLVGVILPGSEPDEVPAVTGYLSTICMAALSGALVGAAAVIVADFFRG